MQKRSQRTAGIAPSGTDIRINAGWVRATATTSCQRRRRYRILAKVAPTVRADHALASATKVFTEWERQVKLMSRADNLRHLDKLMKRPPECAGRNKAPKNCRQCMYYQPKFRFRTCLFTRCKFGLDCRIFRAHPLREELVALEGRVNWYDIRLLHTWGCRAICILLNP